MKFDNNIIKEFRKLPLEIKEAEFNILENHKLKEEFLLKIKLINNKIHQIVEKVIDENGKAVFSNVTKRSAETEKRLESHDNYQEAQTKYNNISKDLKISEIELSYMKRKFRFYESLARLN